jgi:hypothetical protein
VDRWDRNGPDAMSVDDDDGGADDSVLITPSSHLDAPASEVPRRHISVTENGGDLAESQSSGSEVDSPEGEDDALLESSQDATIPERDGDGDEGDSADDLEGMDDMDGGDNDRKHVCPRCQKRFNRPSSLKTHLHTHTGSKRKHLSSAFKSALAILSGFFLLSFSFHSALPGYTYTHLYCSLLTIPWTKMLPILRASQWTEFHRYCRAHLRSHLVTML